MKALDRKLFRDLWHLRGQVLAIAAVIGAIVGGRPQREPLDEQPPVLAEVG